MCMPCVQSMVDPNKLVYNAGGIPCPRVSWPPAASCTEPRTRIQCLAVSQHVIASCVFCFFFGSCHYHALPFFLVAVNLGSFLFYMLCTPISSPIGSSVRLCTRSLSCCVCMLVSFLSVVCARLFAYRFLCPVLLCTRSLSCCVCMLGCFYIVVSPFTVLAQCCFPLLFSVASRLCFPCERQWRPAP